MAEEEPNEYERQREANKKELQQTRKDLGLKTCYDAFISTLPPATTSRSRAKPESKNDGSWISELKRKAKLLEQTYDTLCKGYIPKVHALFKIKKNWKMNVLE